jgi:DNA polymerase I
MKQFIIDGFNLAYRSHFAFKSLTTATGLPSGGIYGFLTSMRSLRKRFSDSKFCVVWDNEAINKKEVFADYKANRVPFRIDMPIRDLKEALKCLNVLQAEAPKEEADDVISSIVAKADDLCYVYTSDKDMLQLVQDGKVVVISPKVGAIQEKFYDEEAVKNKYGVQPKDLACYFTFRGDDVDNIPGVPRVPSKVLASLSDKYKSSSVIYENLDKENLTDFQRQSIKDFQNQSVINSSLITLKLDIPYTITEGKTDPDNFQKILDKYEIKSISSISYTELFNSDNSFLLKEGPKLKAYSLFEE